MAWKNKILVVLAVALVAAGAGMTVYTMENYMNESMETMDDELWEMEEAIDDEVAGYTERFERELEYTATRPNFINGESVWTGTGDNSRLLKAMRESSLSNRNIYHCMLAVEGGSVVFSTDELSYEIEDEIGDGQYTVRSDEGEYYIALEYKVDDSLSYLGVMDAQRLYKSSAGRMAGTDCSLIMADVTGNIVLSGDAYDRAVGNVTGADGSKKLDSFKQERDGSTANIRQAVMPAEESGNGIFSISVYGDFNRETTLFRKTAGSMIVFLLMIAAGIILFVVLILLGRRRELRGEMEIKQLKEKAKAMEELNAKTQELAHHQRLETIGTLTSSIAHEFNNLLTPIMGYSLMTLEKIPDTTPVYDDILEIYNASCKAKDIISRLSELSRKNTEMVFTEIGPDVLVNKVLNVAAPALPKNVDVHRDLNCAEVKVKGNEIQLSQLLLNLVMNAYQAMEISGGVLTVSTGICGDEVSISIKDTGKGIPDEIKDKIFDPFFTTKENGKGTGLGLAIAAQAVEDHGGRITVESEPGEGTEFTVFLTKFNG